MTKGKSRETDTEPELERELLYEIECALVEKSTAAAEVHSGDTNTDCLFTVLSH